MPNRIGEKHPSLKSVLLIANALNITVDDLLIDVQKKNVSDFKKEETSLLAGCTEKQRHFVMTVCHNIKEEIKRYDEIN